MIQLNLLAGSIDQDDGGFRSLRDDVEMKSPSDSNAVAGFTLRDLSSQILISSDLKTS